MDLVGMIEQFSSGVLEELDYRGEAYNALRLAENMANLPGVHVPAVYSELSTSKVITEEFIHGVKVSDVEAIEGAGLDREEIARNALRAPHQAAPVDGFFHADPHPGNLLVDLDTGVLTFIDLGMMGELELQKRLRLAQLMIVAQQGSVDGIAGALRGMSVPFRGTSTRRPSAGTSPGAWGGTWVTVVWSRSARSPARASSCCASTACGSTRT